MNICCFWILPSVLLLGLEWGMPAAASDATASSNNVEQQWAGRGCIDDVRGKWFREAKFGAFIHFGLYSELGGYYHAKEPYDPAEQIMGLGDRHMVIPWKEYQSEIGGAFNPTNFNARQWVSLIKRAGQKYVIVTAKHHDGFAMFHTATTRYNVVDSTPFARDVIKELADECRRQGIVFCLYYSLGDWTAAEVMDPQFSSYHDYAFAQLKELMTHYGDIRMIWLDNYWYVNDQWSSDLSHAKDVYAYLRKLNPNMLVNDRCGRGASSTDGDYATPENQLKGSLQSRYFEVVMTDTDDDNWGWVKGATNYRSAAVLIRNLIDSTSKGGNFVLNVGPTASGEFPAGHVALINTIGAWMDVNGESIYGTVPVPECKLEKQDGFVCYATKKGRNIYLQVVAWPTNGAAQTIIIDRGDLVESQLLDSKLKGLKLTSSSTNNITALTLERPNKIDPYATVIKLTFKENVVYSVYSNVRTAGLAQNRMCIGPLNPGFEYGGLDWNQGGSEGTAGSVGFINSPANGPSVPGKNCISETDNGSGNFDFHSNNFPNGGRCKRGHSGPLMIRPDRPDSGAFAMYFMRPNVSIELDLAASDKGVAFRHRFTTDPQKLKCL